MSKLSAMRLSEWLDAERGRLKGMAERFEVTPSAVSQWRTNGVPVDKIRDVHEFTGKEVSIEDLLARGDSAPAGAAA